MEILGILKPQQFRRLKKNMFKSNTKCINTALAHNLSRVLPPLI